MNLVEEILSEAGLIKNKTFKETRFLKVPTTAFAVWHDEKEAAGSDLEDFWINHSWTIELYSYDLSKDIENEIDRILFERGIKFSKFQRQWLDSEQYFMITYYFESVEKL